MFNQSMYSVNEDNGPAQPVLVLSGPSSTDITVQVFNTDRSATGEYYSILSKTRSNELQGQKKQHACTSSGLYNHYSELFTQMAAVNF